MKRLTPSIILFLLLTLFIITACDKDCEVVRADWSPVFLYHDGMAPEGVALVPQNESADRYLWDINGTTSTKLRDTITLETSGDYLVSLETEEGKHQCRQEGTITIRDYPYLHSNRALSYFESNGNHVRLITKVIDMPNADNFVAISYSVGLPEAGGGMDYDNAEKKLFASPLALLASCYPNSADLQFPIPPDTLFGRFIHDTALDPNDGLVYFSGIENGTMFIRSTEAYGGNGSSEDIYTEADSPEFVYITTDRSNNIIYWTKRGSAQIYKLQEGQNEVLLSGGPFYDIDYDEKKGLLFFAEDQGSSFGIRKINPLTGQVSAEAQSINGEVTFIFVDEETQEIFWVNNQMNEIWKKRISFQMNTAERIVSNVGKIKGIAIGNFPKE